MELMDNSSNITVVTPKLIEFPKHFSINTQLYEKQTLKPVPFKFYVSDAYNPFMLLQSSIDKTIYYHTGRARFEAIQNNNEHNKQCIIQDKNDPNIFYAIQNIYIYDDQDEQAIRKFQYSENTKQYTLLNSWDIDNAGNTYSHKGDIKILYETDDYFVLSIKTQYYDRGTFHNDYLDNVYGCISLLNKKTFAYTRLYGTGHICNCFNFLLKAVNDTVYILSNANSYTRQVLKVNTSSKVCSVIWTETPTSKREINCNPIQIGDYYYMITHYLEETLYSYKITKMSLDITTDIVNTEEIDINLKGYNLDNSSAQDIAYSYYFSYTLRLIQTDSSTYISLLMHTTPNMPENWDYQSKHILLKMNGNSFDVVDLIQLRDGCYGSLENGDSKHQLWWTKNCVLFYVFDETKEKMVCTYKKPGVFMQIGFDSLNRFITQTSEQTVEILTDTNACTLQADFAEELYDKDNTSEVDTTVSFYAKNFSDEFLEVSVKLTLIGPVVFKENESKELIISTLKTGMRTVPVTITGYGNIQVIITQNT